jgi:hypothetical protein
MFLNNITTSSGIIIGGGINTTAGGIVVFYRVGEFVSSFGVSLDFDPLFREFTSSFGQSPDFNPLFREFISSVGMHADEDAEAYLDAVQTADTESLETDVQNAYRELIIGLKYDGNWNAIKGAGILSGARTLTGALVPLRGATPINHNFVSGDYSRKLGITGATAAKWLDIQRANNIDPQNSKHLATYVSEFGTLTTFTPLMGSGTGQGAGNGLIGFPWNNTTEWNAYVNSTATGVVSSLTITPPCLMAVGRGNSTQLVYAYDNSTSTITQASSAPTSGQNFLRQSQTFETTWTRPGILAFDSGSVIDTTDTTDPLGGNTAEEIMESTVTTVHRMSQSVSSFDGDMTFSCYVKSGAGTRNMYILMNNATDGSIGRVIINPNGDIVSTIGTVDVIDEGDGWWRLVVSATATAGTTTTFFVGLSDGSTLNYTGDGTSSIYVWGAQVNRGLTAQDYLATTTQIADDATFVFRHPSLSAIGSNHKQMWYSIGEMVDFSKLNTRLNTFRLQLDAAIT